MNKKELVKAVYKHDKNLAKEIASKFGFTIAINERTRIFKKLEKVRDKLDKILDRTVFDESQRPKPNTIFSPTTFKILVSPFSDMDVGKNISKYSDDFKYLFQVTVENETPYIDDQKFDKFDKDAVKAFDKIVTSNPGFKSMRDLKVIPEIKDNGTKMSLTILFNKI